METKAAQANGVAGGRDVGEMGFQAVEQGKRLDGIGGVRVLGGGHRQAHQDFVDAERNGRSEKAALHGCYRLDNLGGNKLARLFDAGEILEGVEDSGTGRVHEGRIVADDDWSAGEGV